MKAVSATIWWNGHVVVFWVTYVCPDCGLVRISKPSCMKVQRCSECHRKFKAATARKKEPLYRVWSTMKTRCYNPNAKCFKSYGGRGISICSEWLDYNVFKAWAIETGYSKGLTIERKENDEGYRPDNCCWATRTQQSRHKRTNVINEETAELIRCCVKENIPSKDIQALFGVDKYVVSKIKTGKAWKPQSS